MLDTEAFGPSSGRRVGARAPGLRRHRRDRRAARHRASTPGTRTSRAGCCPGSTCSTRTATRRPSRTRPSRDGPSGTGPGSPASSPASRGPAGLQGVAPGASLLPIRVAGWQPDADGSVSVYGRTDQVLAGLEAAVDPNGDGDAHDAARIALVGVVEPFASFPDGPLARAGRGALALGTLVVAPAGNDGPAGPATEASAPRREPPACSASPHRTRAGAAPPSTSCSVPGSAFSRRVSRARRRGRAGRRRVRPASSRSRAGRSSRSREATRSTASSTRDGYSRVAGVAVLLPVRADDARDRARARRCRRAGRPRRRADPRRLARRRRAGRGADRRHRRARRRRSADDPWPPVSRSSSASAPPTSAPTPSSGRSRRSRATGLALDGGAEHGARGPRRRARDVGARPQRGRRGALRDDQRLERGRRGRRRARRRCSPRHGPTSTPPGLRGALVAAARRGRRRRRAPASSTRPPRRPSSWSPTRRSPRSGPLVGKRNEDVGARRRSGTSRAGRSSSGSSRGGRRGREGADDPGAASSSGPGGRPSFAVAVTAAVRPAAARRRSRERCAPSSGLARAFASPGPPRCP